MKVIIMGRFVFLFFVSIPLLFYSKVYAADGCIANVPLQSNGRLYVTLNSVNDWDAYGTGYNNPNSIYCIKSRSGSCTVSGLFTYTGTPVTYTLPVGCPIDDYNWFLILPLGGLGFYYMRKRTQLQFQEDLVA
ncbi:hypothetical protein [Pedobacter sp. Leaf250]|uniref:hypothetical protein n=1 Tax=Pedobacter sp. Leaf250 TaxID=2876559 RepID=UPI001E485CD8|nr:hypothetical protein [Pedobacter sp. Leaf250]